MAAEPKDSGMASLDESSIDVTPEKPKAIVGAEDDDEDIDETFVERLVGLTEMFPEPVVNFSVCVAKTTTAGIKGIFNLSRNALWIVASSSLILFGPLVFEVERAQLEETQRSQQKQFLLGPHSVTGSLNPNMAMTPR